MYVTKPEQKTLVLAPHNFSAKIKHTSIFYCARCGLVPLNNEASKRAVNKGCYLNVNHKD